MQDSKNAALKRQAAGFYSGTVAGMRVVVEWMETQYGDKGWMLLVNDEPMTDYPRTTKRECVQIVHRMAQQVRGLVA